MESAHVFVVSPEESRVEQVVAELPDLEPDDVTACLRFASARTARVEAAT